MSAEYTIVIEKDEDGYYVGSVPALPGCHRRSSSPRPRRRYARRRRSSDVDGIATARDCEPGSGVEADRSGGGHGSEPAHGVSLAGVAPERGMGEAGCAQARGWPPKLDGKGLKWVYDTVVGKNPLQFPFALWTAGMVRELIAKRLGVQLSHSSVCRLLGQMRLSVQRTGVEQFRSAKGFNQTFDVVREIGKDETHNPPLASLVRERMRDRYVVQRSRSLEGFDIRHAVPLRRPAILSSRE